MQKTIVRKNPLIRMLVMLLLMLMSLLEMRVIKPVLRRHRMRLRQLVVVVLNDVIEIRCLLYLDQLFMLAVRVIVIVTHV
jgi:hypothetical protein